MTSRVALLTAAGSGIGAAAAKKLAVDGWQAAILSSSGKGEALAQELGGLGVTGSNRETADLQRWGRIDEVVDGAGHGPRGELLALSDQVFDDYFKPLDMPVYSGAMFGHIRRKFTLPVGLEVEMDADAGTLRLLQPAVL